MWPSSRILVDEEGKTAPNEAVMEGVEHLGQFVYQMTVSKVKQLRAEQGLPDEDEVSELQPIRAEDEVQYVDAASDEDDEEQEEIPQELGDIPEE